MQQCIDKISSLSCQKVAYSITSPKIGGNAAKQTSVLLRNTSEHIRCYPSSYCTVQFLINKSNPSTVRRGVVDKESDNISIQKTYYAWAYHRISVLFPLFLSLFFLLLRGRGWSGGAMVLGKLSVPGRPTSLNYSMARAYCAYRRCG